jgi:hypothetical protein
MRRTLVLLAAMLATVLLIGVGQGPAHADVTAVKGSAYGYFASISLFGGPPNTRGPSPSVTLPPDASASPQTASQQSGLVQIGPAIFFSSGQLTVSTQGSIGPNGSVSSTTNIQNVNTSGQEVFTADNVPSSCAASETAVSSGSTTITNGTLQTDSGYDANGDGDYTDGTEHAPVNVTLPTNPAPNTSYNGHIHVNGSIDNFRYVFNEQIRNPDGSLTVYAAHQRLLGPTAVGDLYIGKSECGVTPPRPTPLRPRSRG